MIRFGREAEAFFLALGTIVGVGMFGIPFAFVHTGLLASLAELLVLTIIVAFLHASYAEIVLSTHEQHRLPGYVRMYLGPKAGLIATASYFFGLTGALFAYIILGGLFLGSVLHYFFFAIPVSAGPALFYLIGISLMFRGIRFEGAIEGILTISFLILIGIFLALISRSVSLSHLETLASGSPVLAYGILMFSLTGSSVIPDIRALLGSLAERHLKKIVISATMFAGFLYALFAFGVIGVTGADTTSDAISGVAGRLGSGFLVFGALIGFFATIKSFISLGEVLAGMYRVDLGLSRNTARLLVLLIPVLLWAAGLKNFIGILSIVGAVSIGIDSICTLLAHRMAVKTSKTPGFVYTLLIVLFGVGGLFELVHIITS